MGDDLARGGVDHGDLVLVLDIDEHLALETIAPEGELRGRLRISAPLTFGPTHIAPILAEMARRHPRLAIQTCYTDRFVDLAAEGYDCAIRIGYLQDSALVARRVAPIRGRLVASPDYIAAHGAPETPDQIPEHEAVMQGAEAWQFVDGDKVISVRPQGRFKADNGTALVAAALAGLGLAWLPDDFVGEHVASGTLVPVMTRYPPPEAGVYVVRPPRQNPVRKIRVLTELLLEYCSHPDPAAAIALARQQSPPPAGSCQPSRRQCLRIKALGDTRADPDCDRIAACALDLPRAERPWRSGFAQAAPHAISAHRRPLRDNQPQTIWPSYIRRTSQLRAPG
ncbi:MAG TPA: substrate binding domain-containing protein [Caulobacter sp.]|nr:substrate binding domain-containing protein [Caulobacter sp.]